MTRTRANILQDIDLTRHKLHDLEIELAQHGLSSPNLARDSQELSLHEYQRYGRQMILNSIGLQGQLQLKRAHILVIGAGGLGCPALLFLAAAGIGQITILDHDDVELSNLHRQVLHTESRIGMAKAISARIALESINSDIRVHSHVAPFIPALFHSLSSSAPPSVIAEDPPFSLMLDCTDNPATRHFLNSYAVAHNIPLVSGGAVRTDGVVGVYGLKVDGGDSSNKGPCYACVFPPVSVTKGPSSEPKYDVQPGSGSATALQLAADLAAERTALAGTGACSDEGVLGVLCGAVGIQMASEAIKVLTGKAKPTLHLLSPLSPAPLRTVKVRERKTDCTACGTFYDNEAVSLDLASHPARPSLTPRSRWNDFLASGNWPGWEDPLCERPGPSSATLRPGEVQVSVKELSEALSEAHDAPLIVDVRPRAEFDICSIPQSINVPFAQLLRRPELAFGRDRRAAESSDGTDNTPDHIYLICRRGNESRLAARAVRRFIDSESGQSRQPRIVDVAGGITAWARDVDAHMPIY